VVSGFGAAQAHHKVDVQFQLLVVIDDMGVRWRAAAARGERRSTFVGRSNALALNNPDG
jgi:hypothetical protein